MRRIFIGIALLATVFSSQAQAVPFGGVEFPDGAVSFADLVVDYSPTAGVGAGWNDPSGALGIPDWTGAADGTAVSLGNEGSLTLQFTDNSLTTSGDTSEDLWVFEIGAAIEPTSVFISTNAVDWIFVGSTSGSTSGVDIDSFIGSGVILGESYSFVRLVDLLPHQSGSPFTGADIDAVGAISSAAPVPEPSTMLLLGSGLVGLLGYNYRRGKQTV